MTFDLEAKCGANARIRKTHLWVEIHTSTEVQTSGTLVPVPNRLNLLPGAIHHRRNQRLAELPFVFDQKSDASTKQAAGIVASWFGMKADHQSVRFPVSDRKFPAGNVVLLATRDSMMAAALGIDGMLPSVCIRTNPNDPYGKVLAIVADTSAGLVDAARAFALERYTRENDSSPLSISDLPSPRVPYDAPRWLDTSREVRLAEEMSDSQLEVKGTGSINLYFRLASRSLLRHAGHRSFPPPLPVQLVGCRKQGPGAASPQRSTDCLKDNPTDSQTDIHEEIVYLPVASIYPRNTLTVEFVYDICSTQGRSPQHP